MAFTKLNVDESPNVAQRYGVYSIPTVIVFKGGEPVNTVVGLKPKKDLKNRLEEVLGT